MNSHIVDQGSATYGTRARLGTRSDFQWHAEDAQNGCIQCIKTFIVSLLFLIKLYGPTSSIFKTKQNILRLCIFVLFFKFQVINLSIIRCLPYWISMTSAYRPTGSVELAFRMTGLKSSWSVWLLERIWVETRHILQWYQCQYIPVLPKREVSFRSITVQIDELQKFAPVEALKNSKCSLLAKVKTFKFMDSYFHTLLSLTYLIAYCYFPIGSGYFRRMEIADFEMQHFEFKASK